MYSIVFRPSQISHLRSCLRNIKTLNAHRHAIAPVISHRQLSTESKVNSPKVQNKDSDWQLIYTGMLGPRIRNLKIVSFMTSGLGLCVQPLLLQKAAEAGSSIAATIGVCTITGFFTFVTPLLIHMVTRKYVTSLEYNEEKDEYIATVISLFLKPKQVHFKAHEVRLPASQKLTVTFYAKKNPFFVDPHAFDDVTYYQRMLGYDKPYEFIKDDVNVCKKPVVKASNQS